MGWSFLRKPPSNLIFEAMLWLHKGVRFASVWTVREQYQLPGVCFKLQTVYKT
uniref:hypothetical protein n=1 Tax=Methylobacterium sp. TaxID=409 RepID=UPI003F6E18E1